MVELAMQSLVAARLIKVHLHRQGLLRLQSNARKDDQMPSEPNAKIVRKPLYQLVYDVLARRIGNGTYTEGENLPNEYLLSQEFEVSIGTIRAAVQQLVDDRLVIRQAGRGTRVNDRRWTELRDKITRIRFGDGADIGAWRYRELEYKLMPAPAEIAQDLEIEAGQLVHYIHRLRYMDCTPNAILEEAYATASLFPDFEADDAGRRDCFGLAKQNGVILGPVESRVYAGLVTPANAELLGHAVGAPLLRIHRRLFTIDGKPVETREMLFVSDDGFHFTMDNV